MPRRDVLRAIFFPNEQVDSRYATTVITANDGTALRGLVVTENSQILVLKSPTEQEPVTVQKTQIASRTTEPVSIMPQNLPDTVSDTGVRDVTAYIMRTLQ